MKIPKTMNIGADTTNPDVNSAMLLQMSDVFSMIINNLMTQLPQPSLDDASKQTATDLEVEPAAIPTIDQLPTFNQTTSPMTTSLTTTLLPESTEIPNQPQSSTLSFANKMATQTMDIPTQATEEPILKQILNQLVRQPNDPEPSTDLTPPVMPTDHIASNSTPLIKQTPNRSLDNKVQSASNEKNEGAQTNPAEKQQVQNPSPYSPALTATEKTPAYLSFTSSPVNEVVVENESGTTNIVMNTTIALSPLKTENINSERLPTREIQTTATSLPDNMNLNLQVISLGEPALKQSYDVFMKIHPPALGEVIAKLHSTKSGTELHISAENKHTQELIIANIAHLKNEFQQSGFSIQQIKVDVQQQNAANQQQSGSEQRKQSKPDTETNAEAKPQNTAKRNKKLIIDTYA